MTSSPDLTPLIQAELIGPALVKAVSALLPPGSNTTTILETSQSVLIQRAVKIVQGQNSQTVIHMIQALWNQGLNPSSICVALGLLAQDTNLSPSIQSDIKAVVNSGLVPIICVFVSTLIPDEVKVAVRTGCSFLKSVL